MRVRRTPHLSAVRVRCPEIARRTQSWSVDPLVLRSARGAQSLQRCFAVHPLVRRREAAEVGEPPSVRDAGDGAVSGICQPQVPVGALESDHPQIGHRRRAQVPAESLLQRAHADVALLGQCQGGQRQVSSGLDDVHPVAGPQQVDPAQRAPRVLVRPSAPQVLPAPWSSGTMRATGPLRVMTGSTACTRVSGHLLSQATYSSTAVTATLLGIAFSSGVVSP
jgi:hypothetical protein